MLRRFQVYLSILYLRCRKLAEAVLEAAEEKIAFNSLFEMPVTFRDAANVAEKIYPFNSLFEMQKRVSYLRRLALATAFNSLFEMLLIGIRQIKQITVDIFQFSI